MIVISFITLILILGLAACAGSSRDDKPGRNTGFYGGVNFGT